jgi:hypothetical protein
MLEFGFRNSDFGIWIWDYGIKPQSYRNFIERLKVFYLC